MQVEYIHLYQAYFSYFANIIKPFNVENACTVRFEAFWCKVLTLFLVVTAMLKQYHYFVAEFFKKKWRSYLFKLHQCQMLYEMIVVSGIWQQFGLIVMTTKGKPLYGKLQTQRPSWSAILDLGMLEFLSWKVWKYKLKRTANHPDDRIQ